MSVEIHPGFAIWFTGLPASGKTTLAHAFRRLLETRGVQAQVLDSDQLREVLTPQPTYSDEERAWFYHIVAWLAELLTGNGVNVLIAATGASREFRRETRRRTARFAEVYVDCPPDVCRKRDPKGLWARADAGEITNLPGANAPYELPPEPEARVNTARLSPQEAARAVLDQLRKQGFIEP